MLRKKMRMVMPKLDYYFFPSCPFCQRVSATLDDLKIKVTEHNIRANEDDLNKLVSDTGRRTVPCLYIDNKPMHESADIINWLKANQDKLEKLS